nr:Gag-Pol polyprotein [Tanacetum cinerariifolium]
MQTQTSNTLHNAIMEAGGKDRPMLAPGNYVQWKSRINRYIDTKPNHELIYYCLKNPPYKFTWADKEVLISKGSSVITTERVDACPNACEMWKAIKRLKQGESINSQELKTILYHKPYDILKQHQNEVNEIRAERIARTANPLALVAQQQPVYHPQNHPTHYTQNYSTRSQQAATKNRGKDKEIDKLMALISLSFKKIYKPTNNNLRTSSNTSGANQDNSLRINRSTGYENQRIGNIARAREIVESVLFIGDSGCSKYMTGNLKLLINFVEKFLGMVKFGNDQIAPILGYGDLVQGYFTTKQVYNVERLNHNLFFVGQFCDADLEVAFRKSTCYIHDLKGNDLLTDILGLIFCGLKMKHLKFSLISSGLSKEDFMLKILHQTSVARTPEQNGVVERRNYTLVEAAQTMLSAAKVPLFFWAEAIATSFKFFHIFGSISYIVRDGENLDKMKEKGDACIFMGYSTLSRAYRVFNKRTRVIVETIHVNFDELPHMASDHVSSDPGLECPTIALEHTTHAPTCQVPTQAPTITSTKNMNQAEMIAENAQVENDEFINIFCTPVQDGGETSSHHVDSLNMHTFYQHHPSEHRWTKDHPLEQVIGNPSQSVRTRRQLESDVEMCMFALIVSQTEPKNIKEAMADSAWIESM